MVPRPTDSCHLTCILSTIMSDSELLDAQRELVLSNSRLSTETRGIIQALSNDFHAVQGQSSNSSGKAVALNALKAADETVLSNPTDWICEADSLKACATSDELWMAATELVNQAITVQLRNGPNPSAETKAALAYWDMASKEGDAVRKLEAVLVIADIFDAQSPLTLRSRLRNTLLRIKRGKRTSVRESTVRCRRSPQATDATR